MLCTVVTIKNFLSDVIELEIINKLSTRNTFKTLFQKLI
jgi:phage-related holin